MVRSTGLISMICLLAAACSPSGKMPDGAQVIGLTCKGTTEFGGTIGTQFTDPSEWIFRVDSQKNTVLRYVRTEQKFKPICEGACKTTIHNGSILIEKPEGSDGHRFNLEIDRVTGQMEISQMIRVDKLGYTTFDSEGTCQKSPIFDEGREPQKF